MPGIGRRIVLGVLCLVAVLLASACGAEPPSPGAGGDAGPTARPTPGSPAATAAAPNPADGAAPAGSPTSDSATTVANRNDGDAAAITGVISFPEGVELPPGSAMTVELRDVSLTDVASTLVASADVIVQGRGPIPFRLAYDREAIRPGNTYAVQASVTYPDGSLGFTTDTAYEVITQGGPSELEIVLALVSPPPANAPTDATIPAGDWFVVTAPVSRVDIAPHEDGYLLTATYLLPGGEECSRLQDLTAELVDAEIYARLNILAKRDSDGSASCASPPREASESVAVAGPFAAGESYRVRANERLTNGFTPPPEHYVNPATLPSPIMATELRILEKFPPVYQVMVVSALPKGSGCSAFNGYDIDRVEPGRINVRITHHEDRADAIACTQDYPSVETVVDLGDGLESGQEYVIDVNGETLAFVAQ